MWGESEEVVASCGEEVSRSEGKGVLASCGEEVRRSEGKGVLGRVRSVNGKSTFFNPQ